MKLAGDSKSGGKFHFFHIATCKNAANIEMILLKIDLQFYNSRHEYGVKEICKMIFILLMFNNLFEARKTIKKVFQYI